MLREQRPSLRPEQPAILFALLGYTSSHGNCRYVPDAVHGCMKRVPNQGKPVRSGLKDLQCRKEIKKIIQS